MKRTCTAVLKRDGEWWIGWVEEVLGVNCQEPTREALVESLRVTYHQAARGFFFALAVCIQPRIASGQSS